MPSVTELSLDEARVDAEAGRLVQWFEENGVVTKDSGQWLKILEKCEVGFYDVETSRLGETEMVSLKFKDCGKDIYFMRQKIDRSIHVKLVDSSKPDADFEVINVKLVDPVMVDMQDEWVLSIVSASQGRLQISDKIVRAVIS